MSLQEVKIKLLGKSNRMPTRVYQHAAGFDVYASLKDPVTVEPGQTVKIPLGFATEIPVGYAGFLMARSGTATNAGIAPANKVGLIDSDYRGEWLFPAHNHSDKPYEIHDGDKIGQIVFLKVETPQLIPVNELSDTMRGEGGFNSSGTR